MVHQLVGRGDYANLLRRSCARVHMRSRTSGWRSRSPFTSRGVISRIAFLAPHHLTVLWARRISRNPPRGRGILGGRCRRRTWSWCGWCAQTIAALSRLSSRPTARYSRPRPCRRSRGYSAGPGQHQGPPQSRPPRHEEVAATAARTPGTGPLTETVSLRSAHHPPAPPAISRSDAATALTRRDGRINEHWPCNLIAIPFASIVGCLGTLDHASRRSTASSAGNRRLQGQPKGWYSFEAHEPTGA